MRRASRFIILLGLLVGTAPCFGQRAPDVWRFNGPIPSQLPIPDPANPEFVKAGVSECTGLALDPTRPGRIFVATRYRGVHRSVDGGATWKPVNNGITLSNINGIALDASNPRVVYAASEGRGVFKSEDEGETWIGLTNGLTGVRDALNAVTLRVDPKNGRRLFLGTDAGVFRSVDGGATWLAASRGLPAASAGFTGGVTVRALALDPRDPATLYAGVFQGHGVFKSTDGGETWVAASEGLRGGTPFFGLEPARMIYSLAADPFQPGVLYAGTFFGMFKSTDGGASWRKASRGVTDDQVFTVAVDPRRAGRLYAGTGKGRVFRSVSGGDDWDEISRGLTTDKPGLLVHDLAPDPGTPNLVHAATALGVFTMEQSD